MGSLRILSNLDANRPLVPWQVRGEITAGVAHAPVVFAGCYQHRASDRDKHLGWAAQEPGITACGQGT